MNFTTSEVKKSPIMIFDRWLLTQQRRWCHKESLLLFTSINHSTRLACARMCPVTLTEWTVDTQYKSRWSRRVNRLRVCSPPWSFQSTWRSASSLKKVSIQRYSIDTLCVLVRYWKLRCVFVRIGTVWLNILCQAWMWNKCLHFLVWISDKHAVKILQAVQLWTPLGVFVQSQ